MLKQYLKHITTILVFILGITQNLFATTYYCANNGNDKNTGTSQQQAFKSIEHLNKISLNPGDTILFCKGHVFTGQLDISQSGQLNKSIVIGSYGKGDKPILKGSLAITNWTKQANNTYFAKTKHKIKQLYVNDKLQTIARYPDSDYLRIDKYDSTFLYDSGLSNLKYDLEDATLRALTCNWQWEIRKVKQLANNKLILDSLVWQPFKKGFAYYFENKPDFLSHPKEWYQNSDNKQITLISDVNPSQQNTEATIFDHGIYLKKNTKYIKIQNIDFRNYAVSAIYTGEHVSHINIENNNISQTEIFGIHLNTAAQNCTIRNNRLENIRGKGIDLLEPQNSLITKNHIKKIGLIAGYGFDGANNGTGIAVTNNEFRDENYTRVARNNTISYNYIDSTGYNGIRVDGTGNLVECNVVKNAVLTMNDGGGIYCWALSENYNYTSLNTFRNNIVIGVKGNTTASAGDYNITACFYIDNFSNHITLENNIAVDCKKGFLINDAACDITLKGNMTYDTRKALIFDTYKKEIHIRRGHNHVTGNTFFLKKRGDIAVVLKYQRPHKFEIGFIDSNLYINPLYKTINEHFERQNGIELTKQYTLKKWQIKTGFDKVSKAICTKPDERWWELKDHSQIFINDTTEEKMLSFQKGEMKDIYGNEVTELELPAFSAVVLLKQE